MKAYNLIEKSLYELFSQYNKEMIDLALEIFKLKEPESFSLLIRKYGIEFNGIGVTNNLSFAERERLQKILNRFEARIQCCNIMHSQKYSVQKIKKMYKEKNALDIMHMEKKFMNSAVQKDSSNKIEFTSLNQILKKYNITVNQLDDAISLIGSSNQRLCYSYTYGINRTKMAIDKILNLLNIDRHDYDKILLDVEKQLPSLVEQVLKDRQDKTYELANKEPKVNKTTLRLTFYDYFYTEEMTEEEKIKIKKIIDSYMEKTTSKGKEVVIKIYGETLDQYHDILLIKEDNIAFNSFIQAMKKYIQKSLFNPDFKSRSREHKLTFYNYFYTEEMTEEEKIKIKKIIDSYMEKTTSKGKEVVIKIYGETLDQYHDILLIKEENHAFNSFIPAMKKHIQKSLSNPDFKSRLSEYKLTFYDYFYTE